MRNDGGYSIALASVSAPLLLAALNLLFPQAYLLVRLIFHFTLTHCRCLIYPQAPVQPSLSPLSLSRCAECVREHQPHHVSGQPAAGVGSLRLPADQADLGPAGEGVEGFRRGTG